MAPDDSDEELARPPLELQQQQESQDVAEVELCCEDCGERYASYELTEDMYDLLLK